MIPEAPGQLGNTLQQERRVPAAPHYRVSAGPPCQTPERKDRGGRGPQREVSHSGAGGGEGTWGTDISNLAHSASSSSKPSLRGLQRW